MSRFDSPIFHPVFADRRVEMKKAYEAYLDAVKSFPSRHPEYAAAVVRRFGDRAVNASDIHAGLQDGAGAGILPFTCDPDHLTSNRR